MKKLKNVHLYTNEFSDNRCPYPKVPRYSIPTTIIASSGAKVNFTCEPGYTYEDNTVSKEIICQPGLTWDSVAPDCKRKLKLMNYLGTCFSTVVFVIFF